MTKIELFKFGHQKPLKFCMLIPLMSLSFFLPATRRKVLSNRHEIPLPSHLLLPWCWYLLEKKKNTAVICPSAEKGGGMCVKTSFLPAYKGKHRDDITRHKRSRHVNFQRILNDSKIRMTFLARLLQLPFLALICVCLKILCPFASAGTNSRAGTSNSNNNSHSLSGSNTNPSSEDSNSQAMANNSSTNNSTANSSTANSSSSLGSPGHSSSSRHRTQDPSR